MASQAVRQFRRREVVATLKHANVKKPAFSPDTLKVPNPFLPRLNAATGRWAPPKYSLRRQAVLVKKAKESNTLHLLPPGPKLPMRDLRSALRAVPTDVAASTTSAKKELWQQRVEWEGEVKEKKVAGADVGNKLYAGKWRMFKGHKWQRTAEQRSKKRAKMLQSMKGRIVRFKKVCSARANMQRTSMSRSRSAARTHVVCGFLRRTSANDRTPSVDPDTLERARSFRTDCHVESAKGSVRPIALCYVACSSCNITTCHIERAPVRPSLPLLLVEHNLIFFLVSA